MPKPPHFNLPPSEVPLAAKLIRVVLFVFLLYLFFVALGLMGDAFKLMAKARTAGLFEGINSPFAALAVGILATVLVQSSSTTTSLVVVAVGSGQLGMDMAVFTVMGCNMGTTITNTIISAGHVRQDAEFRRAFAGATMHDFFNFIAVLIFLPLEMATGILRTCATSLANMVSSSDPEAATMPNPVKESVKWVTKPFQEFLTVDLGLGNMLAGSITLAFALVAIALALLTITKLMRVIMAERIEKSLNRVLERSGVLAIIIGALLTVSVQSSSITTSLMIPLFAAGILKLENGFPVTLGANFGTTFTALLASLASNVEGLAIALVHLLFNVGATLIIFPYPPLRRVPIRMALLLATLTSKSKLYAFLYVLVTFIVIPLIGIKLFN